MARVCLQRVVWGESPRWACFTFNSSVPAVRHKCATAKIRYLSLDCQIYYCSSLAFPQVFSKCSPKRAKLDACSGTPYLCVKAH